MSPPQAAQIVDHLACSEERCVPRHSRLRQGSRNVNVWFKWPVVVRVERAESGVLELRRHPLRRFVRVKLTLDTRGERCESRLDVSMLFRGRGRSSGELR